MKQLLLISVSVLTFTFHGRTQDGIGFGFGVITSYLQFQPFQDYATTYNDQFSSSSLFTKPLEYNPVGIGYEGTLQLRLKKWYSSLRLGKTSSLASKASFTTGDRIFKFKNYNFDITTGFTLGDIITPYITLTINSLVIDSYFKYSNGFESYGSERPLSGIYSSNKLYSAVGLRIEQGSSRVGFYIDLSYPLTAKTYLGGSFDKSTIQTDAPYFPSDNTTYGDLVVENAMPETYRNIRLGIGLLIYITDED